MNAPAQPRRRGVGLWPAVFLSLLIHVVALAASPWLVPAAPVREAPPVRFELVAMVDGSAPRQAIGSEHPSPEQAGVAEPEADPPMSAEPEPEVATPPDPEPEPTAPEVAETSTDDRAELPSESGIEREPEARPAVEPTMVEMPTAAEPMTALSDDVARSPEPAPGPATEPAPESASKQASEQTPQPGPLAPPEPPTPLDSGRVAAAEADGPAKTQRARKAQTPPSAAPSPPAAGRAQRPDQTASKPAPSTDQRAGLAALDAEIAAAQRARAGPTERAGLAALDAEIAASRKKPADKRPAERGSTAATHAKPGAERARSAATEDGPKKRSSAGPKQAQAADSVVSKADSAASRRAENRYLAGLRRAIERRRHYPESARRLRLQGTTRVQFTIAANGAFSAVRVSGSAGHSTLDEAALATVRRLGRFKPIPGAVGRSRWTVRVPIVFRLN